MDIQLEGKGKMNLLFIFMENTSFRKYIVFVRIHVVDQISLRAISFLVNRRFNSGGLVSYEINVQHVIIDQHTLKDSTPVG